MRTRIKSLPGSGASGKGDGEGGRTALTAALAGMILSSREHHSSNFPNPERQGCLPPRMLRALIESGELPGAKLRSHLFGCSECFQGYRTALDAHRTQADALATPWWRKALALLLLPNRRWVLAAAPSLVLLILAGGQWMYRSQTLPLGQGRAAQVVAEPAAAVPPVGETPEGTKRHHLAMEKAPQVKPASGRTARSGVSAAARVSPPPPDLRRKGLTLPGTAANTQSQPPPAEKPAPQTASDSCRGGGSGGGVDSQDPMNHKLRYI